MRAFLVCKNELGEETLKAIGEAYSEDDGTDGIYFGNGIHNDVQFLTQSFIVTREEIKYAPS
jgi:hypothetical protein